MYLKKSIEVNMHPKEVTIYLNRIQNFLQRMESHFYPENVPLQLEYALVDRQKLLSIEQVKKLPFSSIRIGEKWGEAWQVAWFHVKGKIPAGWAGKEVVARINLGGEGLIFTDSGEPLQSLSSYSVMDPTAMRDVVHLPSTETEVEFWIEVSSTEILGIHRLQDPTERNGKRHGYYESHVRYAYLSTFNRSLWHLALDLDILFGLLKKLPQNSVRFIRILKVVNRALAEFADDIGRAEKARAVLRDALKSPACPTELTAFAIGHAHIDTAWLWPIDETIRKCGRTFSNQLMLLKKYPQYVFGASQAQHYLFAKEHYPAIYQAIKRLVKEGRWEVQGAMWVEADCNLPSGESLTRQILYGKNFFMDEFGVDVKNVWLPDGFGFSPSLPQILKRSGVEYFLTQKLSWNQVNDFPYSLFIWRGIEGSEVLAHFPPEDIYRSPLTPEYLIKGRENFMEKDIADEFLSLFGIGDGGGGPKEEHIENGLRLQNLEGAPKVKFASASAFFETVKKYRDELPVWTGDLYLEAHRGTFTSQARVKKANRQLEFKLRLAEMLACCLPLQAYPADFFEENWKRLLLNQFHDIIPGSSINEVYQTVFKEYEQMFRSLDEMIKRTARQLFTENTNSLLVFNSLPFTCDEVIILPDGWSGAVDDDHQPLQVQQLNGKTLAMVELPALGYLNIHRQDADSKPGPSMKNKDDLLLENARIRYRFDPTGKLVEAYDKEAQHSIFLPGMRGNLLQLFEDRPNKWDAWDIDSFYEEQLLEIADAHTFQRLEAGPLRNAIRFTYRIGASTIEQTVYLRAHSKRLDFETAVQWHESHRMLRVAFQVNIQATQAAFDVQYGYFFRPTHRNSAWERARFEVAAHKYADLSQPDYGVALLNDSKYGYKVQDNELNLNLLRAPTYPDPDCDRGEHSFVYSLLPHIGDLVHSDVMQEALQLNQPPVLFNGLKNEKDTVLPFRLSGQFVHLEAVKKAEKENALILRLVEARGMKSHTYLNFSNIPAKIIETDLLEWQNLKRYPTNQIIRLEFEPFEIKTLKIFFE
ncbi:alpha-mannosidase [Caldithrix abyssi]